LDAAGEPIWVEIVLTHGNVRASGVVVARASRKGFGQVFMGCHGGSGMDAAGEPIWIGSVITRGNIRATELSSQDDVRTRSSRDEGPAGMALPGFHGLPLRKKFGRGRRTRYRLELS
jgi:hypothetical protein